MNDLPDFLVSGEKARLFPVLSESSKEGRTLSAFLSCFALIDELGAGLLSSLGRKTGARSRLETFTEVVLKNGENLKLRPDGLIIHCTGQSTWTALVEAKIKKNEIQKEQVESYLRLARENKIDAVITVSNQFATSPHHSPIHAVINKSLLRNVDLFHWSWMSILTQCILLTADDGIGDEDQELVLREFARFLEHESAEVASFNSMNPEWKDLVQKVQTGAKLAKKNGDVETCVASWHQEVRDLCLIISRRLSTTVRLKLPRKHRIDPGERLNSDCDRLAKSKRLECTIEIPNAAGPLHIRADLMRRAIVVGMRVSAPADRVRAQARVNWLLRQLVKTDDDDIQIRSFWPGSAETKQLPLNLAREDASGLLHGKPGMVPTGFEVLLVRDLAGKFSGRRSFIDALEVAVPEFYEQAGQHLRAWVESPPVPKNRPETDDATVPEKCGASPLRPTR